MKLLRDIPSELSEKLELPDEVCNCAKATMWNNKRLLIEGTKGLLDLSEELISLSVTGGKMSIRGTKLSIKAMNAEEMIIEGSISALEWG